MPVQHLEHALVSLEQARAGAAIEHLMAAWRSCRAAELAQRLDVLSGRIARSQAPITGKSLRDRLTAWAALARQGRLADRGGLIDVLLSSAVAAQTQEIVHGLIRRRSGPAQPVVSRLDEVLTWVDDPRAATVGLKVLAWSGNGASWSKVFTRAFQCIEVANDPRAVDALVERLHAERGGHPWRPTQAQRDAVIVRGEALLVKLRERWPAGVPPLPVEARPLLLRLDDALAQLPALLSLDTDAPVAVGAELQALWQAVYQRVDDDSARAVLADALLERGDERGEFIALQLRQLDEPRARRREAALLTQHARAWLGPLASVVATTGVTFGRGFPVAVVAHARSHAQAESEFAHLEWATVERLSFRGSIKLTPALTSARSLQGLPLGALKGLTALDWPRLEQLGIDEPEGSGALVDAQPVHEGLRALAVKALPTLRALSLRLGRSNRGSDDGSFLRTPRDYQWLKKAPWGRQLQHLSLDVGLSHSPVSTDWLNAAADFGLQRLTLVDYALELVLEVASGELTLTTPVGTPAATLERALDALDATRVVKRLTVVTHPPRAFTPAELQRLQRAARALSRWQLSWGR